ncbi:MAG: SlyX family protein [Porticoccaceae bacterium]|jgi:SlyX protein|nr:SlyX family protein [Porticoccaceae bacterium]
MTENERITELEIRLAYLEDTLSTLDAVIARQSDQLQRMEKTNKSLVEHLESVQERLETLRVPGAEPPPPHY